MDPKIVDKIRKLLSLGSNNDVSKEADAAIKKAAKLAEENGLALSDINQETGKVNTVKRAAVNLVNSRYDCWANPLAAVVASCFDCQPVVSRLGRNNGSMIFIGTPTDIELALWYYKLIRLKTIKGGSTKFKLIKDQKMYGRGVLLTMQTRLTEIFKKEQEKIRTSKTTALVLVKKDAVNEEVNRLYPNLKTERHSYKMNGSYTAFKQGQADGASMGLERGNIGNQSVQQIA